MKTREKLGKSWKLLLLQLGPVTLALIADVIIEVHTSRRSRGGSKSNRNRNNSSSSGTHSKQKQTSFAKGFFNQILFADTKRRHNYSNCISARDERLFQLSRVGKQRARSRFRGWQQVYKLVLKLTLARNQGWVFKRFFFCLLLPF